MVEWTFSPIARNKYKTLKKKAQDRPEWRRWSMVPVFGQDTRRKKKVMYFDGYINSINVLSNIEILHPLTPSTPPI